MNRNVFKKAVCRDWSTRGNGRKREDRGYRGEYYFTANDGTQVRRRRRFKTYLDARKWVDAMCLEINN